MTRNPMGRPVLVASFGKPVYSRNTRTNLPNIYTRINRNIYRNIPYRNRYIYIPIRVRGSIYTYTDIQINTDIYTEQSEGEYTNKYRYIYTEQSAWRCAKSSSPCASHAARAARMVWTRASNPLTLKRASNPLTMERASNPLTI